MELCMILKKLVTMMNFLKNIHFIHHSIIRRFCSKDVFKFSDEVSEGLLKSKPVVALESTVITHGLPYPDNLRTACQMEDIIRQNKAIPATIGIIEGKIHVGMNLNELGTLAGKNKNVIKVSRRDLPFVSMKKLSGGTTVAATMAIAHRAGIQVFVTGGIGGVHRGGENTMDVSADLYELSRTPMTVLSAGVKSILDIGRTLEYLETLGVCVSSFGPCKEFPSFFTPKSRFSASCNVETFLDAARLIDARDRLHLESGILIAVPIPDEFLEDGLLTESVIEQALTDARERGIVGREVTPFVLSKVRELSNGASLRANIGLLKHNADVGSKICVELCSLQKGKARGPSGSPRVMMAPARSDPTTAGRPVVIGGSILDIHVKALEHVKADGRTLAGEVKSSAGGVGRNVADALARMRKRPFLLSAVGALEHASALLGMMGHMDRSGIATVPSARTATCVVLLDQSGECLFLVGDMDVHRHISVQQVESHCPIISGAPLVVIDGNLPSPTIRIIIQICSEHKIPMWFEPTDLSCADRPFRACPEGWQTTLSFASPNINELRAMHNAVFGTDHPLRLVGETVPLETVLEEAALLGRPLLQGALHTLFVTLGSHGVLLLTRSSLDHPFPLVGGDYREDDVKAVHYPAPKPDSVVSVSGAGDCFAAGAVGGILSGLRPSACVAAGQRAALLSLASPLAVPPSVADVTHTHPEEDRGVLLQVPSK